MKSQHKGSLYSLFFIFCFVVFDTNGTIFRSQQRVTLSSFFFLFSFFCFVAFGHKWAPSPSFGIGVALVVFFSFPLMILFLFLHYYSLFFWVLVKKKKSFVLWFLQLWYMQTQKKTRAIGVGLN